MSNKKKEGLPLDKDEHLFYIISYNNNITESIASKTTKKQLK